MVQWIESGKRIALISFFRLGQTDSQRTTATATSAKEYNENPHTYTSTLFLSLSLFLYNLPEK